MTDEELLATLPDFVRFDTLMKARPAVEDNERIIYVEASTEARDQEGEIVLSKALKDSLDIFLKFGVVDLDHKSMPSVAQKYGIPQEDCPKWIIGQPVAVRFDGDKTIVKAQLRQGDGRLAEQANQVWDGLTKMTPPDRYYASVGGSVLTNGREIRIDPKTKDRIPVITKTRWNNLALSLNPVNQHLGAATTLPIGTFAKAYGGFILNKALEAGYATNSAGMTGGQALATQSLDTGIHSYFDFRERLSRDILAKKTGRDITNYVMAAYGLPADQASEWVEKFLQGINKSRAKRQ